MVHSVSFGVCQGKQIDNREFDFVPHKEFSAGWLLHWDYLVYLCLCNTPLSMELNYHRNESVQRKRYLDTLSEPLEDEEVSVTESTVRFRLILCHVLVLMPDALQFGSAEREI